MKTTDAILTTRQSRRSRRALRGFLTVELVLTLPIVLLVLVSAVMFSQLLMSHQAVSAAASNGAREAALPGASEMSVREAVLRSVNGWRLASDPNNVELLVRVNGVALDIDPTALTNAVTGDVVEVTVRVPAVAAVPNMLSAFGLSIANQHLATTFVERKE